MEPVDPTKTRVVLVDDANVPLANVAVDARIDGAFITVTTNSDGIALFDDATDLLTIRPDDRDWTSVFAPAPVVVVTAPSLAATHAITGELDASRLNTQGDMRIAFVAFAQRSLVDLDLASVLGDGHERDFSGIPTVELPSSVSMNLGDDQSDSFVAKGNERDAFALAVEISLADIGSVSQNSGLLITNLLRSKSSLVDRADHEVLFDVSPSSSPVDVTITPATFESDAIPIFADALPAGTKDLVAAAFVRTPDSGFILLGITDAFDDDGDGHVSDFKLFLAPPHDGLEGSAVTVVVAALDLDSVVPGAAYDAPASVRFFHVASHDGIDARTLLVPPSSSFDGVTFGSSDDVARVDFTGTAGAWHVYGESSFDVTTLTADGSGVDRTSAARAISLTSSAPLFSSSQQLDDVVTAMASAASN